MSMNNVIKLIKQRSKWFLSMSYEIVLFLNGEKKFQVNSNRKSLFVWFILRSGCIKKNKTILNKYNQVMWLSCGSMNLGHSSCFYRDKCFSLLYSAGFTKKEGKNPFTKSWSWETKVKGFSFIYLFIYLFLRVGMMRCIFCNWEVLLKSNL